MPASGAPRQLQVGDVLNHIFEVRRFIARGGMGEVFEGTNVNSDERVAIKVILPHLAADANVQAMFRKEARTLTRLSHSGLVQYRVLAQEPQFGVLYIVTEYVDGPNLSDVLRTIDHTPADLLALTHRLAEGLQAAHGLGAIHRDISPDNVMLEGGSLAGAKIIDFGIAKDLDPSSATIVGDGFAGKLNYVAPEQLGDFDRDIGPWTDVYSLALLILAVALRKDVDMGGSLVDAVDKRRAGPDLSPIPEQLRPVLEKMLKPNPADRPRSMGEVIELLSRVKLPAVAQAKLADPPRPRPDGSTKEDRKTRLPLILGGGAAVALLLVAGLWFGLSKGGDRKAPLQAPTTSSGMGEAPAPVGDAVARARVALDSGLPSVACTWLDVTDISQTGNGVSIALRGVAGKPADAQGQLARMLAGRSIDVAGIDFADVSPIQTSECGPLEAFRQIRDPAGGRLAVAQRQFEMGKLGDEEGEAGKVGATAIIDINLAGAVPGAALFGLDEAGKITPILPQRADFDQDGIEKLGEAKYRLPLTTTHEGWSGVLLLTGKPPFDSGLIGGASGSRGADWPQKFLTIARSRGWKSEMVWYKTVDQQPNTSSASTPGPAPSSSATAKP
jgi:serine/threonine-protein kinase